MLANAADFAQSFDIQGDIEAGMFGIFAKLFGKATPLAKHITLPGNAVDNLAAHAPVNRYPKGRTQGTITLPIWFDFEAANTQPATYENVFWDVEPMGEYLYFLAGDFLKNEKGLLRFGTAPIDLRVERNFEQDVLQVSDHDGTRMQTQAVTTNNFAALTPGMSVGTACNSLVPLAQTEGFETWTTVFKPTNLVMAQGRSRLSLGFHFITGTPYLEVLEERLFPATTSVPFASLLQVKTRCTDPQILIHDLIELQESVAARYTDAPATRLTGAIRL